MWQKLSEEFIENHSNKVNWRYISEREKLSESFIEKHSDKVYWDFICIKQKLSELLIEKFSDKVNWECISLFQKLSEPFIETHSDKINWKKISRYQKLSELFIENHSEQVDWKYISKYQKLSEPFIEKFSDKVEWYWTYISEYQVLSLEFIIKNKDKIDFESLLCNQNLVLFQKTNFLFPIFSFEPNFTLITTKKIPIHKELSSYLFNLSFDEKTIQIPNYDDFKLIEELIDVVYQRKQMPNDIEKLLNLLTIVKKFCFNSVEEIFTSSILEKVTKENYRDLYEKSQDLCLIKLESKLKVCLSYLDILKIHDV